jgi:hypothetical protein
MASIRPSPVLLVSQAFLQYLSAAVLCPRTGCKRTLAALAGTLLTAGCGGSTTTTTIISVAAQTSTASARTRHHHQPGPEAVDTLDDDYNHHDKLDNDRDTVHAIADNDHNRRGHLGRGRALVGRRIRVFGRLGRSIDGQWVSAGDDVSVDDSSGTITDTSSVSPEAASVTYVGDENGDF